MRRWNDAGDRRRSVRSGNFLLLLLLNELGGLLLLLLLGWRRLSGLGS